MLETSDLPGGVVNILTGPHEGFAKAMAGHLDVDAVWNFSSAGLDTMIETESAGNLKRVWGGAMPDWMTPEGEGRAILAQATEIKTTWIPYGEGMWNGSSY